MKALINCGYTQMHADTVKEACEIAKLILSLECVDAEIYACKDGVVGRLVKVIPYKG